MAAVGRDGRGRQALAMWDLSRIREAVPVATLLDAKVSLHHIRKLAFLPADSRSPDTAGEASHPDTAGGAPHPDTTGGVGGAPPDTGGDLALVSVGYENVYFWRLRRGKLCGCALPLQHHEGSMMLDLAVDARASHTLPAVGGVGGGGGREAQEDVGVVLSGKSLPGGPLHPRARVRV